MKSKSNRKLPAEAITQKLQNLLHTLRITHLTADDIMNVICHERDPKDASKLVLALAGYTKSKKDLDLIASIIFEAWNNLPHLSLNGCSPSDKYREIHHKE